MEISNTNLITKMTTMGKTKTEDRLLMIVDGSNLAHRSFHKFKNLTYKGEHTGLIYGFMRILQSYMVRFRPTYVLVTFDTHASKSSNFRNELLGSYKEHRIRDLSMDYESFNQQTKILKKMLRYLNIPVIWDKKGLGHESDDYIGHFALKHTGKVVIVSSDKDFCQLLSSNVKIFNPSKETLILEKTCKDIMGYSPNECVDYLCLLGDKSDDIPGYKGMGEKNTRIFLDEFGSIDAFLKDEEATYPRIDREALEAVYHRNLDVIDIRRALRLYPLKKIPIAYPYKEDKKELLRKLKLLFIKYGTMSFMTSQFLEPFNRLLTKSTWHELT